jgi:hypothetical protein
LRAVTELLRFEPAVGLSLVVDLMAFGLACPADPDLRFEIPFRARADIEPPVPPKRSELARSDEDKEPDILEIAKTFVKGGIAPNAREHTTLVMSVLKKEHPGNHPKRKQVEELLTIEFKNQRRSRGRANRSR